MNDVFATFSYAIFVHLKLRTKYFKNISVYVRKSNTNLDELAHQQYHRRHLHYSYVPSSFSFLNVCQHARRLFQVPNRTTETINVVDENSATKNTIIPNQLVFVSSSFPFSFSFLIHDDVRMLPVYQIRSTKRITKCRFELTAIVST